jgi:hypothetical protein
MGTFDWMESSSAVTLRGTVGGAWNMLAADFFLKSEAGTTGLQECAMRAATRLNRREQCEHSFGARSNWTVSIAR